jgi:hypothetical protein
VSHFRARLTYANVTATLALFIAIAGGTAFAVDKINGSQIKNRSIGSEKFKRDASIAHAEEATRTSQLLLSGNKPTSARSLLRADEASTDNVVRMSAGETATVLEKDPFTITAACIDKGDGAVKLELYSNTTEPGSWHSDNVKYSGPLEPGHPTEFFNDATNGHTAPGLLAGVGRVALVAPSGRSLDIGAINAGFHLFGTDCSVTMYAIS